MFNCRRRTTWTAIAASIALLCATMAVVGAERPGRELPAFLQKPSPQHVRVFSYNVNWDSIFEDGDPDNHPWRALDRSDQFVRIIQAVQPDILCLQEINPDRDSQDVADILDAEIPLGGGQTWRSHAGSDNVICSRWDLSLLATDTIPATNRGQAMALVDLPDAAYDRDLYLMNAHFKAGSTASDIQRRQRHADAIINWIRDIRTPGGNINLEAYTPIVVVGDLNVYDTDPHHHLTTLITGDIVNESTYGPDFPPDWDGSEATDALPLHNGVGPEFYTWRDDGSSFDPGALDRIIYSDTVLSPDNSFVLNTVTMSPGDLAEAGLEMYDVIADPDAGFYDHLPLVADFAIAPVPPGDYDRNGLVDLADYAQFAACLVAPEETAAPACQDAFGFDPDLDVDLHDFAVFQVAFGTF